MHSLEVFRKSGSGNGGCAEVRRRARHLKELEQGARRASFGVWSVGDGPGGGKGSGKHDEGGLGSGES